MSSIGPLKRAREQFEGGGKPLVDVRRSKRLATSDSKKPPKLDFEWVSKYNRQQQVPQGRRRIDPCHPAEARTEIHWPTMLSKPIFSRFHSK
jgi:hypothetical protein